MANIVVSMYNFLLKPNNVNSIPPFYEGFIKGLRDAGNKVICFEFNKVLLGNSSVIPEEYLETIKNFKPDLFIFFNNQFWDITKYFNVPIIVYDVDSPNAYYNLNGIIKNKNLYKFIVNQDSGKALIKDAIDCDSQNIKYIRPFTSVKDENIVQDINISFCGTNWFWQDFKSVINFTNSKPNSSDIQAAKKVYDLYIQHPTMVSSEIYSQFNIEADKKLTFDNLFFYACRVSGIKRLRYLTEIADLGLEIRGQYWLLKDPTLAAFPEILLSYSTEPVNSISSTQQFFNRSKLSLNTKHIQAKTGFSWRVCDILASNACLVTEPASDLNNLGFKVPTFTSPAELREQCLKLLNNENMRKDIVAHSQEIINKNHRFKHILPEIEDFIGLKLHSEKEGSLEIIPIFNAQQQPDVKGIIKTKNPEFPFIDKNKLTFKGKLYHKIAKHFYKRIDLK